MTADTSLPSGSREAITASSSGSEAAKTRASAIRKASGSTAGAPSAPVSPIVTSNSLATSPILILALFDRGGRFGAFGAHPDRRESAVLPQLDHALAGEFERRGERGGARRPTHFRIGAIGDQPGIEFGPIDRDADQPV